MSCWDENIVFMVMFNFLVSFLFLSSSFAACFSNEAEYLKIKSTLPKILQEIPVYFTGNFLSAKAAGTVQFFNKKIRFSFNGTSAATSRPIDPQVKSICIVQGVATLIFFTNTEDGTTHNMKSDDTTKILMEIVDDDFIKLNGNFFMKKVAAKAYNDYSAKITKETKTENIPLGDPAPAGIAK